MIPRVAFGLVLVVLALILVVALGAQGRLDYLPPQPYFPAALERARLTECDERGARYPEFATPAVFLRYHQTAMDAGDADRYGLVLRAAQERSMSAPRAEDVVTVRFTWLRSFHNPVVVRIDAPPSGQAHVTAKQLDGHGGYDPGKVTKTVTRRLSRSESATFLQTLAEAALLKAAVMGCGESVDGSRWIIEVNDRGQYHYFNRHSPIGGPVRSVGEQMLALSGLNAQPVY